MTWSYSGNPKASQSDEVRFILGDTDTTDQLVSDEEIQYGLSSVNGTVHRTVYLMATAISSKFGRMATLSLGQVNENYVTQSKFYADLASKYAKLSGMSVNWGGAGTLSPDNAIFGTGMMNNNAR